MTAPAPRSVAVPASIARSTIRPLGDGWYVLVEPFIAEVDELGIAVHVPSGYRTNLASIPGWAWWWIGHPATGEFQDAAVLHDWICDLAAERGTYSIRLIGDALFLHLLQCGGVPYWKRKLMYMAVWANGYWSFRKQRTRTAEEGR